MQTSHSFFKKANYSHLHILIHCSVKEHFIPMLFPSKMHYMSISSTLSTLCIYLIGISISGHVFHALLPATDDSWIPVSHVAGVFGSDSIDHLFNSQAFLSVKVCYTQNLHGEITHRVTIKLSYLATRNFIKYFF